MDTPDDKLSAASDFDQKHGSIEQRSPALADALQRVVDEFNTNTLTGEALRQAIVAAYKAGSADTLRLLCDNVPAGKGVLP